MKKFKLFNLRPFVFGAVSICAGIFFAIASFAWIFSLIFLFVISAIIALLIVYYRKKINIKKYLSCFVICIICFCLGSGCFAIREIVYQSKLIDSQKAQVIGRVQSVSNNGNIILDSVEISGKKRNNDIYLIVADDKIDRIDVGDIIIVYGKLEPVLHFKNNHVLFKNFSFDQDAKMYGYYWTFSEKTNKNLFDKIKIRTENSLKKGMTQEEALISYSMLFGDKTELDDEIYDSYKTSGIAHLLAVSGLHIGFVTLLLCFFLDALKTNKKLKFLIVAFILFLYAFICGFSPSVVRAMVMALVLLFADVRGKQYDGLSALSFSAIIILAFNPMSMFEVGFQLSFAAVLGIICLMPLLNSFISRVYPKKLATTFAILISAQILTIPLTILYFGTFSTYSIITNLIAVPIASLAFMVTFVISIITFAIPQASILFQSSSLLLKSVNVIAKYISKLPASLIHCKASVIFIATMFLSVLIASDFFLLKSKYKYSISGVVFGFGIISLIAVNVF